MRLFLALALLFTAIQLFAQTKLTGSVTDAASGEPIPYATVYLDGTSVGDVTAEDGSFAINVYTARRPLTVVVSHLNYLNLTFPASDLSQPFAVKMKAVANALTSIEVEDVNQREKNLREFRRRLVGSDEWGAKAKIRNESVLVFSRDRKPQDADNKSGVAIEVVKKGQRQSVSQRSTPGRALNLKATTKGPLEIELPAVGYLLRMDLVEFVADYSNGHMRYLKTDYFTPLENLTPKEEKRIAKNRVRAYFGSQMHFLRSLIRDSLNTNGYAIYEIVREDERGNPVETNPIRLPDYVSLLPDGNFLLSGLEDKKLAILHYSDNFYYPRPSWKRGDVQPLQSRLYFAGPSRIYPDGTCADTNLVFSGDMANRKMGWWLPSDYTPTPRKRRKGKRATRR